MSAETSALRQSCPPSIREALTRLERFGGRKLLREMIALFLQIAPGRLDAARAAVAAGDVTAAEDRAALPEIERGAARRDAALAAERAGRAARPRCNGDEDHRVAGGEPRRASASGGVADGERDREVRVTTVAVVEDNADNRLLLQALLGERYSWSSSTMAWKRSPDSRASLPDLVLLDISLPGMDGNEILARIRADERLRAAAGDRAHGARDVGRSREVSQRGLQRLHYEADRRRDRSCIDAIERGSRADD